MACEMTLWYPDAKQKKEIVCDEENAARIVEDEHKGSDAGEYTDVAGKTIAVNWSDWRLVRFHRRREGA